MSYPDAFLVPVDPDGIDGPAEEPSRDAWILDRIAATLDGTEWGPETVDAVAELVRGSGRTVADVDDDEHDISLEEQSDRLTSSLPQAEDS